MLLYLSEGALAVMLTRMLPSNVCQALIAQDMSDVCT